MTELSVVIPTRDRRDVLLETLARLERTGAEPDAVEVVVVDDGSSDGTPSAVRTFADTTRLMVRLVEQEGAGPAAARNRGVATACGSVCLFLGDDTWPRGDLLSHHLAFHHEHPEREDALLGLVVWAPPLDRSPFMQWLVNSGVQFEFHNLPPTLESVGGRFFYTSNVSAKTELLRAVSAFDESFPGAAGEDVDLGLRLERVGMRLAHHPDAVVEHWHPTDLSATLKRMWVVGQASARLAPRHPQRPVPRPPGARHRVKAAVLTVLATAPARPRPLQEEIWRFLCHEAFREAYWAEENEQPERLPRIGVRLARRARREPAARPLDRTISPQVALNQLVRFEPVLALVRETDGRTLLDVGSGSAGLAPWLGPRWSVTAVDTNFEDYGGAVGPLADSAHRLVADARRLPFPDRSFDVTVAIDLLEHVGSSERPRILAELCRVTARRLIVAGPAGAAALAADERLADLYRRRVGRLPGWLEEHLEHGLPEPAEIEAALRPHGRVQLIGNESVHAHERIVRFEARRPGRAATRLVRAALAPGAREMGRPRPRQAARVVLRLLRGRDHSPTYRTIAVLDLEPSAAVPADASRRRERSYA